MTQNNSILPSAIDTLKKSEAALMDIANIIKWSGVVDIINGAAARGRKEVDYRYIDFDMFMETGGIEARNKFVEELCRAGYHVEYVGGSVMRISWKQAGDDDATK